MHSQKQFSSTLRVPVWMCMQRRSCLRMLCESRCACVRIHCIYTYHAVSLGKFLKTSLLDCCLPIFQCRTGHSNICRSPNVCACESSWVFFFSFWLNLSLSSRKHLQIIAPYTISRKQSVKPYATHTYTNTHRHTYTQTHTRTQHLNVPLTRVKKVNGSARAVVNFRTPDSRLGVLSVYL